MKNPDANSSPIQSVQQLADVIVEMSGIMITVISIAALLFVIKLILNIFEVNVFTLIADTFIKCKETLFPKEETKTLQDIRKIILISNRRNSVSNEYVEYLELLVDWYKKKPEYFRPILFKYEPTCSLILATLQDANEKQLEMDKIYLTIKELLFHLNEDVNQLITLIEGQKVLESDIEIQVLINSLTDERKMITDIKKLHAK